MKVIDIEGVAKLAHAHAKDVIVVVDNTFLTSYFQRPLELGADIVAYSLSKYINGHSDVIMGAAIVNDDDLYKRMLFLQNASGIVPSPFDCYQVNRSLKTLAIRMEQHSKSALAVAKYLEAHSNVELVLHPGELTGFFASHLCARPKCWLFRSQHWPYWHGTDRQPSTHSSCSSPVASATRHCPEANLRTQRHHVVLLERFAGRVTQIPAETARVYVGRELGRIRVIG